MRHRFRGIVSAMLALALILCLASPVAATSALGRDIADGDTTVPLVFDAIVLRPLGLMMTLVGTMVYVFPVAPITALTRPTDLAKPFKQLVVAPLRYTFMDPLGQHPF